jgi:5-methylcytosine-specific restriction endonuclease McrA
MNEQEIKSLSDDRLLSSLSGLFDSERITSKFIVLHLIEIDARKLYAIRGFDSMFRMLVEKFKLSESSAYRRLRAMRLMKDVPQIQASLVTGEVNLTTLSMVQSQIRREEKVTGEKVSNERKTEIAESLKNKTQAQTEVALFKLLPNSVSLPKTYERRISDSNTRMGLNFPDRVLNKLNQLREIWSHVNPNMDYVEIIERCADETLKRVNPVQKKVKKQCFVNLTKQGVTNMRPTYYPIAVKQEVYSRAQACCEFIDLKTKNRCRSKFLLQTDHKIPRWAGGTSESLNLQLLCATHNRLKYAVETNTTFISDRVVRYGTHEGFKTSVAY